MLYLYGRIPLSESGAAELAVKTVRTSLDRIGNGIRVVFTVYQDRDFQIYRRLLGGDQDARK